jgi:hypothetical protein
MCVVHIPHHWPILPRDHIIIEQPRSHLLEATTLTQVEQLLQLEVVDTVTSAVCPIDDVGGNVCRLIPAPRAHATPNRLTTDTVYLCTQYYERQYESSEQTHSICHKLAQSLTQRERDVSFAYSETHRFTPPPHMDKSPYTKSVPSDNESQVPSPNDRVTNP